MLLVLQLASDEHFNHGFDLFIFFSREHTLFMLTRKRRNRHFCTKSYPVKIFNSTLRKYPTLELYIFQFHLLRRPPCCPPSRPTTAPSPMLPYWLRPPWHRRHPWLPSPPDAAPSFPLLCWTFSGHRK